MSDLSATSEVIQLTISWSPPSEPNGVIIAYEVYSNSSGYTNTSATQLTLRDLSPNTVVTYSVRAYAIIGPAGTSVTGQTSTGSVREFILETLTWLNSQNSSYCYWSVSRGTEQHCCDSLLDSSQPISGIPLHGTLYYSGWSQWNTHLPSECLLWSSVRTAGRTPVPVQCRSYTQCQWRVVQWFA